MEGIDKRVGLRNIKTAVAVMLCLIVSWALKRDYEFFSCIAAVICTQQTHEKTFELGKNRFIGTCVGGLAGFIGLHLLLTTGKYIELGKIIIIPVFISILIYCCNLIKIPGAISICCIVFLNLVLNIDRGTTDTVVYVLDRIFDTTIGIVSAMVIERWLIIPKYVQKYFEKFIRL